MKFLLLVSILYLHEGEIDAIHLEFPVESHEACLSHAERLSQELPPDLKDTVILEFDTQCVPEREA